MKPLHFKCANQQIISFMFFLRKHVLMGKDLELLLSYELLAEYITSIPIIRRVKFES
jgi:hypothetical protein